jgi:hypothetical protein
MRSPFANPPCRPALFLPFPQRPPWVDVVSATGVEVELVVVEAGAHGARRQGPRNNPQPVCQRSASAAAFAQMRK